MATEEGGAVRFRRELKEHRACLRCGGREPAQASFSLRTIVGKLLLPRDWWVCNQCKADIIAFIDGPMQSQARSYAIDLDGFIGKTRTGATRPDGGADGGAGIGPIPGPSGGPEGGQR